MRASGTRPRAAWPSATGACPSSTSAAATSPCVSDDGQIAVVQNGEIFNHVELAAELRAQGVQLRSGSDTEVILRLYEREGIACLKRLNGMFAIAIDDAREDALYLARDRIGVKPLYVMDDGQRMLFASEIKAFWHISSVHRSSSAIDLEAIHHYLTFNYIPAPWTAYQGVKHVMPGTWMKFTRGAPVQTRRWWSLADQREQDFGFDDWAAEFMALLDDATRIRLRADVPFGAFLSGGVDSSTIVGLMARHVDRPVKTFCIGFEDPRYDESAFALQAAQRFGCDTPAKSPSSTCWRSGRACCTTWTSRTAMRPSCPRCASANWRRSMSRWC
jgi:asparagine synthase (glutamine-hydrolysing)